MTLAKLRQFYVAAILLSAVSWVSAADYSLIAPFIGRYPVLQTDGDPRVAGILDIVADDNGVGIVLTPLNMASVPVEAKTLTTPKDATTLTHDDKKNALLQHYETTGLKVDISYKQMDGYVIIFADKCTNFCESTEIYATQGKSPGEVIDAKVFLQSVDGKYTISTAGGEVPQGSETLGLVVTDSAQATVTVPYKGDSSSLDFLYDKASVFRVNNTAENQTYVILKGDGKTVQHFNWEDDKGQITLRNFQYGLPTSETVCLEHVMKKQ